VVTSHIRSNDGHVQDLATVAAAARAADARVLVDATYTAGILPVDADELGLDYVVAAAYKHLLCPRDAAFMRIARQRWSPTPPPAASWRSAADPYGHYYGGDLSALAPTAARFDVSLAWHAWVGGERSLAFLTNIPLAQRQRWCVGLADELAVRLHLAPTESSLISVRVHRNLQARAALRRLRMQPYNLYLLVAGPRIRLRPKHAKSGGRDAGSGDSPRTLSASA
jgi:selenocysteine lyase/cysteine desulfurase